MRTYRMDLFTKDNIVKLRNRTLKYLNDYLNHICQDDDWDILYKDLKNSYAESKDEKIQNLLNLFHLIHVYYDLTEDELMECYPLNERKNRIQDLLEFQKEFIDVERYSNLINLVEKYQDILY